jgi:hypothetical protein
MLLPLADYRDYSSPYAFLEARWRWVGTADLAGRLRSGGLLLLCDALNEMPFRDARDYRERAGAWRRFVQETVEWPGNRVVVTCRSLDYSPLGLPQVEIERLDDARVQRFLGAYLSEERATATWERLEGSPLLDLSRNPWYLSILVRQVGEGGRLAGEPRRPVRGLRGSPARERARPGPCGLAGRGRAGRGARRACRGPAAAGGEHPGAAQGGAGADSVPGRGGGHRSAGARRPPGDPASRAGGHDPGHRARPARGRAGALLPPPAPGVLRGSRPARPLCPGRGPRWPLAPAPPHSGDARPRPPGGRRAAAGAAAQPLGGAHGDGGGPGGESSRLH